MTVRSKRPLGAASTVLAVGESLLARSDVATLSGADVVELESGAGTDATISAATAVSPSTGSNPVVLPTGHAAPLDPGPRYEYRGLLGEGGMGRVELHWDADLLRDLAVKRLKPTMAGDKAWLRLFLWEARVTAHLDHPNIVPVHDLGVAADGELFFTMKRVVGQPLSEVIASLAAGDEETARRFGINRRLNLFVQLCHAVGFAHSRGVLHRDLKPGNVMIGRHGEISVMDWGLALPLEGQAGEGLRGVLPKELAQSSAGTPDYMSPEQASAAPLDARSDVFTLGVILYELVSLQKPIQAGSMAETLVAVRNGAHRPLTEVWPNAPAPLAAVVARAMALFPADRYASVSELIDDVERVIEGGSPTAEHAGVVRRAARWYVSRDPAMAGMRVVDFDFWVAGAALFGAAVALPFARSLEHYWWLLITGCVLFATPPTLRFLRQRRHAVRRGAEHASD